MKKFSSLSTVQIRYILKKYIPKRKVFVGASDELKLFPKALVCVINSDPSTSKGLHWIALYDKPGSKTLEVFDSFGLPIVFYGDFITNFAKQHNLKIRSHQSQIQQNNSSMCGYFSAFFLILRERGKSYSNILSTFNTKNLAMNERLVKKFFKRFKFPQFRDCSRKCYKKCDMKSNDFSSVCVQRNKRCQKL